MILIEHSTDGRGALTQDEDKQMFSNDYINLKEAPADEYSREALKAGFNIPPLFKKDYLTDHCHDSLPKLWALISNAGSGSSFHVDPFNSSAWNTLLQGRKRWALYPPSVYEPPGTEKRDPIQTDDYWCATVPLSHLGSDL